MCNVGGSKTKTANQQKAISFPSPPAVHGMNEKGAICGRSACWEEQIGEKGKWGRMEGWKDGGLRKSPQEGKGGVKGG